MKKNENKKNKEEKEEEVKTFTQGEGVTSTTTVKLGITLDPFQGFSVLQPGTKGRR